MGNYNTGHEYFQAFISEAELEYCSEAELEYIESQSIMNISDFLVFNYFKDNKRLLHSASYLFFYLKTVIIFMLIEINLTPSIQIPVFY